PYDSHSGAEGQAKLFLDRLDVGGAPAGSSSPRTPGLDPSLRSTDRPVLRQDSFTELKLGRRRGQTQQGSCMAHSEPTYPQVLLDELGESKKPECVRNGGAVLAEPSRQLLLGPPEFGQEPLVGLCGLDWIQILSKEILDETELERLRVA